MSKPFITTLQSRGTHWEPGVLGGEKQSPTTTYNLQGRVGNLGFWVERIILYHKLKPP